MSLLFRGKALCCAATGAWELRGANTRLRSAVGPKRPLTSTSQQSIRNSGPAMRVELAEAYDIEPWMALTQEVIPLFGPMPDFETVLRRKILQKQAYCVRSSSRHLSGAMLFGGSGKEFWIRWLAVSQETRRQGVGKSLVDAAILITPFDATLSVDTFAEGNPGATAASGLYRSCGFEPTELWQDNQIVRQRYMRRTVFSTQT